MYLAEQERVVTVSGLGSWPPATDAKVFLRDCDGRIPSDLRRSVVPAAVDSWLTALRLFGTKPLGEVAAAAIDLAENGFPVHSVMAETLGEPGALALLRTWPGNAATYLDERGEALRVGDLIVQRDLARTLRLLVEAEQGAATRADGIAAARDRFYRGDIAERMAAYSRANGGWLSEADLAEFSVDVEDACVTNYRGYDVYGCGPWCQGPVVLETLNILEGYDLASLGPQSADVYHLVVEALKAAFADRDRYYGDPRHVDVPLDGLLSKEYAASWRARIDRTAAAPGMPMPGDAWRFSAADEPAPTSRWRHPDPSVGPQDPDTSYLCVVDAAGNAFSATPSDGVATAPVVPGLGFILSGRGKQSWLDPGHPSVVQPGKRPRLLPNPGLVRRGNDLVLPYGTPGLDVQPQAMVQFLVNVIDFELDVQSAIEAPRCATYSFPASSDPHPYRPGLVALEQRAGEDVAAALAARGHQVEPWPAWTGTAGSLGAIRAEPRRQLYGGAGARRVAYALGR